MSFSWWQNGSGKRMIHSASGRLLASSRRMMIGDGRQVSIWDDAWVPRIEEVRFQNLNPNPGLIKVADLIDSYTRKWNVDLIYSTFTKSEAERILCIPLALSSHEDLTIWRGESTGEYSVIWNSRNKFVHEGEMKSGSQIAEFVLNYLNELEGLNMDSNRVAHAIATKGIKMGVSTYLSNRVPPGAEAMAVEE
ncbi:hypothetical protein PVK06_001489 [Gossypium arboreum]|uniref:Uncharacterized protein n=1 Tax=Gossypium arboreum TaxID=29729 RepID=A0ABR0R2H3_GOSAR|nr:hypothetical protein PVK06_001489 [Gossypium arboreum]